MTDIITLNRPNREDWLLELANVVTNPEQLLQLLGLTEQAYLIQGVEAKKLFPFRVPFSYIRRIKPGDPHDPLLLQVITQSEEFTSPDDYKNDPLEEQNNPIPGLLHKYKNRVLLLVKGGCAINCRYCFRRHFPYQDNQGNKRNWQGAIEYIQQHKELDEVILSGGDPMMAQDHEFDWLISAIEAIPHIKRLRIHTRLAVVIPSRITDELCHRFKNSRLQLILVTHINHANEIDDSVRIAMNKLKLSGVTLLNQSVLLKGVNNHADTLAELSNALFDAGILPYYLHLLDKVRGAAHFMVTDDEAKIIMRQLMSQVSGYLVPKLVREIGGETSKTPISLN